ncbi:MAG: dUTP diphosphatase [Myxococcales bacterium]|nr:MAG: dUTP diphosphatase [Myxococcales bacterium]
MKDPMTKGNELRVFRINPELVDLPFYASDAAAGLDLQAAIETPLLLCKGVSLMVPTGLIIALPSGFEGQVRPRSGLAAKHGITLLNSPGTIDEDYRGEVKVILINLGPEDYTIKPKERIAQLVVAPVNKVTVSEAKDANELGSTERGSGGFGSTGAH